MIVGKINNYEQIEFRGLAAPPYHRIFIIICIVSNHNKIVLDVVNAAGMDETYGSYVDGECFDIHDYDDDTDHDTDDDIDDDNDDDTDDDADDDTDDGGRGNRRPLLGGAEFIS